ncbi:MAG: amidohydrolase family protein, partial [Nannocystaceae bacterium]
TAYRVSPDGRWLAFVEGFQAHILPMPATGSKPIKVGAKSKSLPMARVTHDAGTFVHWSGDSQTLHWSHGPELFSRALKDSFAFLEGAPETLPEPPEKGINLGLSVAADVPKGTVAIVGARVATMRKDAWNEILEDTTIVIEGNRIKAIGPRAQVAIPAGAHQIQGAGMTVIPGLVDVHAHGAQGRQGIIPEQNWLHYAELAFGVTTIHDPSNDTHTIFAASEMARAGMLTAPRIFSTGTILYGALAPFKADVDSLDDARSHLRRMKQVGAFSVKSYNQPRRNQRQQVLAAGRELGVMVVPEGGSLFHHNMTMVVDGHTGVEHCIPVGAAYSDVFQLWGQTDVGYTPTLGVAYGGLSGEKFWYAHTNVWEDKRLLSFVPRFAVDPSSRRRTMAPDDDWNHMRAAKIAKQLIDAGGKVQLGAHGQREGLAAHWELWMFVQGGMTPHEALRAGTLHGAEYLGLDGDIGSLEPGKLADLVILSQDPLTDIRNSTSIVYTMVNGRLYNAATMDEVGNRPQKRGKFFFEENPDLPTTQPPPEALCHGHL